MRGPVRRWTPHVALRRWTARVALAALVAGTAAAAAACGADETVGIETAPVVRGDYEDVLEIRGDVRPVRTTYVTAPRNAGELQIVKLVRNGATVKQGEVVAEFDAVNMRRTIQEKQSELRSAVAGLDQARAQSSITIEEKAAAVRKASFDVERARLALGDIELVSPIEGEKARLALADAEQRLAEAEAAADATRASIASDFTARDRAIAKIQADLDRAQASVAALAVTAPTDGIVNLLQNYRSSTPMGVPQEFRPGDKTYSGAEILEIPDLSQVFLIARIEEADRGRIRNGQSAVVRADAIADRDYRATVTEISVLARVDFMSGFPPAKLFDLTISIDDSDGRLRPGMSAIARINVGTVPDVLLVPSAAVFTIDGERVVFRKAGRRFERVPVTLVRSGREQSAVEGVAAGDLLALTRPDQPAEGAR
ncbi:MAG: efflux RND transporter periplasmic adaptor subunit [Vicinamibacterales bacterium]